MPTENSHPMSSDAIRRNYRLFTIQLEERLYKGADSYGDLSFTRPCPELIGEVEQELMDICGWSFIVWCRLRKIREAMEKAHLDGHQPFNVGDDAA